MYAILEAVLEQFHESIGRVRHQKKGQVTWLVYFTTAFMASSEYVSKLDLF